MEYNFREIEKKWQLRWKDTNAYKVENNSPKPKFYVLDMFPYPSGAGLHVGHPLGYIASDIYARFKRLKGFNVLHPMGYDAFGLPAEQYAIEKGVHPAISTEQNIQNFRKQLDNIGFCFDWDREVRTSDPGYYKWTQWIFLQLFKSFYNHQTNKADSIETLVASFEKEGNAVHPFPASANYQPSSFQADDWNSFTEAQQQEILMHYRLAYCGIGEVNWCEALGTVLANDEVVNGVSERGGYPVIKKKLRQWYLRITEYADRLLEGLGKVDFSDAMKEMQSNWIGKSSGAEMEFEIASPPTPLLAERGKTDGSTQSGHFFKTSINDYWGVLKQYSRDNRKNLTEAEDILWQRLRNNQLGVKARRQHAIQGYIVDFALLEVNLVVEIDGGYHDDTEQQKFDQARAGFLKEFGFEVIRFTNDEVLNNTETVANSIQSEINIRKNNTGEASETPLSARRGAGGEATNAKLRVYTTRPDTIFGVDFMVIAPEHELVDQITTEDQKTSVDEYIAYVKSRSERERMAEKKITGCFTGAYAINPFNGQQIPIWISEYVLAGYGTGAIMAVPCGDERDFKFAKHFDIPVTNIIGKYFKGEEANPTKDALLENSGFLNGMVMRQAIDVVCTKIEELGIGKRKVNYKMRDAAFSRQRYWGEPFPIKWIDGIAYPLDESGLPLELPHVEKYGPGPEGEGPLSNIQSWTAQHLETNTMPGYAGSSWYFLRYMDPHNNAEFCNRSVSDYWGQVDLYIGGTEHAVGHLLYSRMWTKVLYDLGHIGHDEPYKKLVNQGMIQGSSRFVYRSNWSIVAGHDVSEERLKNLSKELPPVFLSKQVTEATKNNHVFVTKIQEMLTHVLNEKYPQLSLKILNDEFVAIHVDVSLVDGSELNINEFRKSKPEYENAIFIFEEETFSKPFFETQGTYICGSETEKMSKRYYNVVNPDDIVNKYGADTFRMYEMFLGPVEQSKPWDTKGIEGVHRFLRKLWRMFYDDAKGKVWTDAKATDAELKILHKAIKKIEDDTERFSFNTAVSAFMVCVNELTDVKCNKKEVLEPLVIMLTPYAPHIAEELYQTLNGATVSVLDAAFPIFEAKYLVESSKEYPISINGKLRTTITMPLGISKDEVQETVLANEVVAKWLEGKPPKNLIYVPNKMVNVVI